MSSEPPGVAPPPPRLGALSRIWRIGLGVVLIVVGLTVVSHRRPSSGSMSGTMFPWMLYFVPGIWLVRAGLGGRFITGRRP